MQRNQEPVTVESVIATHRARRREIRKRLGEFDEVWRKGSDARLWEELAYCIFTAGASARMGIASVDAVRTLLLEGQPEEMTLALKKAGAHRFPVARPAYIVTTRNYFRQNFRMQLRKRLRSFSDPFERRDWLAQEKQVKGLGYKESSHFLRNIGIRGHAILDKHVMRCLTEVGVTDSIKPPATRKKYLEIEQEFGRFAKDVGVDFDELDLVLWSMKTGEILK
ncbi:MAG TPA: N-glycosylase/DNA lyase [Pyrinomonadaceae bacterium]|nr:N-glycosylase/DNA lyase [Pyrinomonadaceae bacterium]